MKHSQYQRRTFLLFALVGLFPATIVSVAWCCAVLLSGSHAQTIALTILALGLIVAVILSTYFAVMLSRPVDRLHKVALELAGGHFEKHHDKITKDEFGEIFAALEHASERLQQTLSEDSVQMELIEAERNKLRGVLNSMTDGVFALDSDGRIILFNHAAMQLTGRPIGEVAGQLAEKVMPFRRNGEMVMTRWLDSQLGTNHKRGEWRGLELYRADGTSLYVNVQAITLNEDPNGIRALITFHDLTDEHRLEEMKIDFVALAAHELRTPITEIKGYLDIMQHEPIGLRKSGRELVDRAMLSLVQLSGLVNNLLGVARIEHGEVNYHRVVTPWNDLIRGLRPQLERLVLQNGRKLTVKLGGGLPQPAVDDMAMQEIFNNLISNAINHTEPGSGKISITTKLVDHEIETSVTDNGDGIPSEAIKHLFTKFYRYEGMHTTHGTGLGLYICKSIIENHGGYIWAESELGKGATFTFRLPAAKQVAGIRPPRHTTNVTKGAHGWIKDNSIR